MTKQQAQRRREDAAIRELRASFPARRLRWIDRLTTAIDDSPYAPSGTELQRTTERLREQLLIYRAGFVHGLNLRGRRK